MGKTKLSSTGKPERPIDFMTSLASAFLEWFLMFLLFLNAAFSYAITKFARYCNLPLPCLLCSRLDHVLGNHKVEYFRDLLCRKHKSEISSLVLCHAHSTLVDVHGMCETCLFSFATINKSNSETYRLLVGKLGDDPEGEFEQDPLLEAKKHGKTRWCSCCKQLWCPKGYLQKLLKTSSTDRGAASLDIPVSPDVGRKLLEHTQRSTKPAEASEDSSMHHVEYTELKVTSDTESEVLVSEYELHTVRYESSDRNLDELEPKIITLVDDSLSEKLIHPSPESGLSLLVSHTEPDIINSVPDSNVTMHGLEELNWHHGEPKVLSDSAAELISFDDLPLLDTHDTVVEDKKENVNCEASTEDRKTYSTGGLDGPKETSPPASLSGTQSEMKNDSERQSSKSLDLGDAYNLAIGNKGKQSLGSFGERNFNNSAKISEDLKLLLSQISRRTDLTPFDMSPRVSRNLEEMKLSDPSNYAGLQMLQKRISLERNASGLESLDGSVSEVEGESLVDRLKRQIEHDKKLLLTLYKELEEERNASAISANQAMAMITRLQEEKAALHMDASQYLRMMEEQAEYDMEALQNANDLIAEREVEIQSLEAELEHYRSRYPDEEMFMATMYPSDDLKDKFSSGDQFEGKPSEERSFGRNFSILKNVEGLRTSFRDQMRSSFFDRENERATVSDFSNKLKELSENEVDSRTDNDDHHTHGEDTGIQIEEVIYNENSLNISDSQGTISSIKNEGSTHKETPHTPENGDKIKVTSEIRLSSIDVDHEAVPVGKSSPDSPENQHKEWHMVQEIDLEEDKGRSGQC